VTAVDWFFENETQGIIIEDDLEFNEDFLVFCSEALKRFLRANNVWMISGSNFFHEKNTMSTLAITYPMIWGWATSREKWQLMRSSYREPSVLEFIKRPNSRNGFFWSGSKRANQGIVNTWDLPIAFKMQRNSKLCILPPVNLVSNVGVDSKSSHTLNDVFPLNHRVGKLEISDVVWSIPSFREINRVNKFYEQKVFMVRKRHILSPVKLVIERVLASHNQSNHLLRSVEIVEQKWRR
jgi:GR25 family glycosyltransferase involved in LPS biosynthesis